MLPELEPARLRARSLLEYASARDRGIDQILFAEEGWSEAIYPGRMGLNTAPSLTCLGGALLLTRRAPVIFVASDQADFRRERPST